MREAVSDILTWPWFSEPHGYDFNGHLIRHAGGNICIDPVEPTEDDLNAIAQEGVARILLTNRNHSRAARGAPHRHATRSLPKTFGQKTGGSRLYESLSALIGIISRPFES